MGDQPQLLPPDLERSSSPRVPTSSSHITGNAAHQAGLAPAADQDFRITTAFQNQAADEHAAEAAAGQSGRGPPDVTGPSAAPQNAQGTPVHAFASPSGQQAQQVLGTRHSKPLTGLGLADQAVNTKELKSGLRLTQLHATTTHEVGGAHVHCSLSSTAAQWLACLLPRSRRSTGQDIQPQLGTEGAKVACLTEAVVARLCPCWPLALPCFTRQ